MFNLVQRGVPPDDVIITLKVADLNPELTNSFRWWMHLENAPLYLAWAKQGLMVSLILCVVLLWNTSIYLQEFFNGSLTCTALPWFWLHFFLWECNHLMGMLTLSVLFFLMPLCSILRGIGEHEQSDACSDIDHFGSIFTIPLNISTLLVPYFPFSLGGNKLILS